jgi:protein phosphatase
MGYKLNIVGKTDVGRRRKNNEDTFLIDPDLGLMIVADGMGGHASGEVASKLATELCGEQVKKALQTGHVPIFYHVPPNPNLDPRSLLLGDCVKYANYAVYEAAQNNPAHKDMGTTLVAALWLDDKMAVAHVGDSRLYVYHDGKLLQRTVDHSFVQEQIAKGKLKAEDAEKSDMKNLLTRSVGNQEDVDVDITEIFLQSGDSVLICSDGLTKMLPDKKIEAVFKEEDDSSRISAKLIEMANQAGGADNVTAVVARLEGSASSWDSLGTRLRNLVRSRRR